MHRVFGGAAFFVFMAVMALPASTSAATQTVIGQQITITAAVKPHRFIIVDNSGVIQQIISNTSTNNIEPEVYTAKVAPENLIEITQEIRDETEKLLADKKIKPGVLYDRKNEPLAVRQVNFIELLHSGSKKNLVSYKLTP